MDGDGIYDNLQPGDRVAWQGPNRTHSGTALRYTPKGFLVRLDGSQRYILLSTSEQLNKKTL